MKKFFYLMAMVCTLGFFTACSSDNDDPADVWETFQGGKYSLWAEELDTEDNDLDYEFWDLDMNVEKAGNTTAKVTMTDKTGMIDLTVPEAQIIAVDGYTLRGKGTIKVTDIEDDDTQAKKIFKAAKATKATETSTMEVDFTAKISADNKNVSVELKADGETLTATNATEKPAVSQLLGTWDMEPMVMYDSNGKVTTDPDEAAMWGGSFKMTWEVKENCPDVLGFMKASDAAQMANGIVNQLMPNVLKSVAFTADGKILAQYAEATASQDDNNATAPSWLIAQDYATYKAVNDNQIVVFLNKDKILSTVTDAAQKTAISTILSQFEQGIPVNVRWSNNNNTAYFYVDQSFATALASNTVLAGMIGNLQDEDLAGFAPMIKAIMQQMPELMEATTKFEAGLELVKD